VFHLSRNLYLNLVPYLTAQADLHTRSSLLRACEVSISRMFDEPETAHRANQRLFADLRHHFGLREQVIIRRTIDAHLRPLANVVCLSPTHARRLQRGEPERDTCSAVKSNGRPCARFPAAGQDLCSAHLRRVAHLH